MLTLFHPKLNWTALFGSLFMHAEQFHIENMTSGYLYWRLWPMIRFFQFLFLTLMLIILVFWS